MDQPNTITYTPTAQDYAELSAWLAALPVFEENSAYPDTARAQRLISQGALTVHNGQLCDSRGPILNSQYNIYTELVDMRALAYANEDLR